MSGYIGTQPVPQATQHREAFTATASQTSFATAGYTPQFIDVYLNGVKLAAADYTATNGSDIVLTVGAALGDILEYVAYTPFGVASQTFTGTTTTEALTVTGAFTSKGIDDNATSTAITIDASENVGIGTASFDANWVPKLQVSSSAADGTGGVVIESYRPSLIFKDASGSAVRQHIVADDSSLLFGSGDASFTERARIDSSGNLLVGKTTAALATAGTALRGDNAGLINSARAGTILELNRLSTDGSIVDFFKDGSTVGSIGTEAETMYVSAPQAGGMKFSYLTSTNAVMLPVTTSGAAADGLHDLGYSASRFKDLYLSGGVYLGGTTSANKLDDYETGIWYPVIRGSGTAGSYPLSIATGSYTKVGRFVNVSLRIVISSVSSAGSGYMQIRGLPFIKANNGILSDSAVRLRSTTGVTSYDWPTLEMVSQGATDVAYIFCNQIDSVGFDLPVGGVQANTEISGHLFYEV